MYEGEQPQSFENMRYAASDPLTPVALLKELYDQANPEIWCFLAGNPSLPYEHLNTIISVQIFGMDLEAIRNPQLTLDQVKTMTAKALALDETRFNSHNSVIEIFDELMESGDCKISYLYTSALLCNPHVSAEDFMERVVRHYSFLNEADVFEDARFNPSEWSDFRAPDIRRAVLGNRNITPELLERLIGPLDQDLKVTKALANLNYPIELSASYHIENFSQYKWRPSYLLELETRVDEHLKLLSDTTPWEEIPLVWKLKTIANKPVTRGTKGGAT